jgi:hypothetical protein
MEEIMVGVQPQTVSIGIGRLMGVLNPGIFSATKTCQRDGEFSSDEVTRRV